MNGGHTEGLTVRDYGEPTALAAAECRFALLHGQDGAPVGYVYRAEDAALYAASPDLFEALEGLMDIHRLDGESDLDFFERRASAFFRDTGVLAPGKDAPPNCSQPSEAETRAMFDEWLAARVSKARAALSKAKGE
jgi:hypothetical protein